MRFVVAFALLLGFSAAAEAGCFGWGCYRAYRPCCRPVYTQPVQVQVVPAQAPVVAVQPGNAVIYRRYYATPIRDALFGRYRVGFVPAQQCGPNGCTPAVPNTAVPNTDPGTSVKVDAPGVNVEVR